MSKQKNYLLVTVKILKDQNIYSCLLQSMVIEYCGIFFDQGEDYMSFSFTDHGNAHAFMGVLHSYDCFQIECEEMPPFEGFDFV